MVCPWLPVLVERVRANLYLRVHAGTPVHIYERLVHHEGAAMSDKLSTYSHLCSVGGQDQYTALSGRPFLWGGMHYLFVDQLEFGWFALCLRLER